MTLVFYDGVCGLCDRFVQFLLRRDVAARFRFATLQGDLARQLLPAAGYDPGDLDSLIVIADWHGPRPRALSRSEAVLHLFAALGGGWRGLAFVGRFVPRLVADAVYRTVARRRYRIFGRTGACAVPRPEWRDRFIDERF